MKKEKELLSLFYQPYQSDIEISHKERIGCSYIYCGLIMLIVLLSTLFSGCEPLIASNLINFTIFSIFCVVSITTGKLFISINAIYLAVLINSCTCEAVVGANYYFGLYSITIIPVLFYYLFIGNETKHPIVNVFVLLAINIILNVTTHILYPTAIYELNSPGLQQWFCLLNIISSIAIMTHFGASVITDVKRMQKKLKRQNDDLIYMAQYDALTGLRNRQNIGNEIIDMISNAKEKSTDLTLVLADIDDFKSINDQYGHFCGDKVLTRLGTIILEELPKDAIICRWGGEEFLFALPYNADQTRDYCNQIRHKLSEVSFQTGVNSFHITLTFGLQPLDNDQTFDMLIQAADDSLFLGKENGKDCIAFNNFLWRY